MNIVLTPGAKASSLKKGRLFNADFGVSVDRDLIDQVFPKLSPSEIALYVTLLRYNDVKGEKDTPTIEEIRSKHFPEWSDDLFDQALSDLKSVFVNNSPLVRINTLGEDAELQI